MGNQHSRVSQEDEKTTHALTWMQPDRHGLAPSPRNGHTADMIEGKLYIFGGGDKAELLNELFVFDTHDHQWSQPPCTGIAPPPRSRHTSGVVDQRLLIWGGIGGGLDVHVLDTQTLAWSTPSCSSKRASAPSNLAGRCGSSLSCSVVVPIADAYRSPITASAAPNRESSASLRGRCGSEAKLRHTREETAEDLKV